MPIHSIVQYEVYVHDHGRWALHARYPSAERDDAMLDARKTELATGLPTRVVRDTYYPEENVSEEVTVYVSPDLKDKLAENKRANGKKSRNGTRQKIHHNDVGKQPERGVRRVTDAQFFSKLILALNRAYVPWSLMLKRLRFKPAPEQNFFQPENEMALRPKNPVSRREAEETAALNELKTRRGDVERIEDVLPPAISEEKDSSLDLDMDKTEDETTECADKNTSQDSASIEEVTASSEGHSEDPPESVSVDIPTNDPPVPLADMDIDRLLMMRFLGEAIVNLRGSQDQIDTMTRYGMSMYVAGAASALADQHGLTPAKELEVLKETLLLLGHNDHSADSFIEAIEEDQKSKKNSALINAGETAMKQHLHASAGPFKDLGATLKNWKSPRHARPVPLGDVFLLTYVNATQSLQEDTDESIDKHTGDGIMATFPDGPAAVAASIQMLQGVKAHNQANPDVQVEIRVGVNTGEAVEEENDFFGQAVQMTARICDKAADGHAWVSDIVVQACKGQKFGFLPRGEFEMKGIERPKPLFEIAWTDAHRDELADL